MRTRIKSIEEIPDPYSSVREQVEKLIILVDDLPAFKHKSDALQKLYMVQAFLRVTE